MTLFLASLALVALLAFALYVTLDSGLRMARGKGTLRLYRLAEARGLVLANPSSEREVRAAAAAARRCAGCASQARCEALLDKRDYTGLRDICPNTAFLDRLYARR